MKRFATVLAATAITVFAGGSTALAGIDDDDYPPSEPTGPTEPTEPTETTVDAGDDDDGDDGTGTLPETGSSAGTIAQVGGVLLVSGLGLIAVTRLRRRRPIGI